MAEVCHGIKIRLFSGAKRGEEVNDKREIKKTEQQEEEEQKKKLTFFRFFSLLGVFSLEFFFLFEFQMLTRVAVAGPTASRPAALTASRSHSASHQMRGRAVVVAGEW